MQIEKNDLKPSQRPCEAYIKKDRFSSYEDLKLQTKKTYCFIKKNSPSPIIFKLPKKNFN